MNAVNKAGKAFMKGLTSPKTAKALDDTSIFFGAISKSLKGITTMGFDALGIILQLGNSMGILQPIMQMFQGVLSIMGGAAFAAMGTSLQDLGEFLFSTDMILFWEQLGTAIGSFMEFIITELITILGNPDIQKFILNGLMVMMDLIRHLGTIFMGFIDILLTFPKGVLGGIIIGIAAFTALIQGMNALPGIAGVVLGTAMAVGVAIALAPLAGLAFGGIVTRPTLAMVGERNQPEAVIPLDRAGEMGFGGGSDQVLWATEDNGKRLDRLVMAIEEQNRIKRMKYL